MKNIAKVIMIVAVSMILFGSIMALVGYFFGGDSYVKVADLDYFTSDKDLTKKETADGIIYENQTQEKQTRKEKFEQVKNLKVDAKDFDVKILPSKDQNFYLAYSYHGKKDVLTKTMEDNQTLYIKEEGGKTTGRIVYLGIGDLIGEFFDHVDYDDVEEEDTIYLYIPNNINLNSINLNVEYGDAIVQKISAEKVDIQSKDGDILMDDTKIKHAKVKSQYGDLTLKIDKKWLEYTNLNFYSKYGDIDVEHVKGSTTQNEDEEETRFVRKLSGNKYALEATSSDGDIELKVK